MSSATRLATIEKVLSVEPIAGADRIELIQVLGYQTVSQKGTFKLGDLCIWINPDTIVPELPEFSFLSKENYRIKVRRFKGVYSRGLAWPVPSAFVNDPEGTDVTERFGVKKYETPIPVQLAGQVKGNFPSFLRKTDEENVQKWPGLIDEMNGVEVYITLKMDGTSATFYWNEGEFGVCSRNMDLKDTEENIYWKMARKFELQKKFAALNKNIAIQGEIFGPGIQSNRMKNDEVEMYVFNAFDINRQAFLSFSELQQLTTDLELDMVPIVYAGLFEENLGALQTFADGQTYLTDELAEGIVVRPMVERYSKVLDSRLSFKVISNSYAVKHGL